MRTRILPALMLAMTLIFWSCTDNNDKLALDGTGRLVVRMTDAPFPYEHVAEANVTVFKVEARRVDDDMDDSGEMEGESNGDDSGSPYVLLMEEEIEMNLLELQNGATQLLADLQVPAGTYDLVRVYMKGINVVLTDETTFDLKVPSGASSGLKVFIEPGITVTTGLSADLLLDFDISSSFVAKGSLNSPSGITGFNFNPVIKASNESTTGSLAGNVSYLDEEENPVGIENVMVSVLDGEETVNMANTDPDGNYMIMGLAPGTYQVVAEATDYLPADPAEATIVIANLTIQDFILEADPAAGEEETETEGGN